MPLLGRLVTLRAMQDAARLPGDATRSDRSAAGAARGRELHRRTPELGSLLAAATTQLQRERRQNPQLAARFADIVAAIGDAVAPAFRESVAAELLVQHLLLMPILQRLFSATEIFAHNALAAALQRAVAALPPGRGYVEPLLGPLTTRFQLWEESAAAAVDFAGRQTLLNRVCESLLRGLSTQTADTHGIIYTPQPLVDFMCASVEWALLSHFRTVLSDPAVWVLDPFTGTGNFIVSLMRRLPPAALRQKYKAGLEAHELLPFSYYIASLNIEHEHYAATGTYLPFAGLRRVDTFTAAPVQTSAPIRIILGNPPYNAWQVDENDNNRNRSYPGLGVAQRVRELYGKGSRARNRSALADPYVKAFRWASDQLGDAGIICYVSNSSFIDGIAFDGMRRALAEEFDAVYIIDLGGNVRREPQHSGAAYNIFGIQVGICITVLVRLPQAAATLRQAAIHYHAVPADWRRGEKCAWLQTTQSLSGAAMLRLFPDRRHIWLTNGLEEEFGRGLPVAYKSGAHRESVEDPIFRTISAGLKTNRDDYAYGFTAAQVAAKMEQTIAKYNAELKRWQARSDLAVCSHDFLDRDRTRIAWSATLRRKLERGVVTHFDPAKIRPALFRPFTRCYVYFDTDWTERRYNLPHIFPDSAAEAENRAIALSDVAMRAPFSVLMTDRLPDFHLCASADGFQCLPLYTYQEQPGGGWVRQDNIGAAAKARFQRHYQDPAITSEDIFYYVYALLHAPSYRQRFAPNLKRELPRIPFSPHFHRFATAGRALAELHVNYLKLEPWPLSRTRLDSGMLQVEAMRLRRDRRSLRYNDTLILEGLPPVALTYRLGNRSALEWVIAEYRVTRDAQGRCRNDPNRDEDPDAILRLIGQVVAVSVKTQELIAGLPSLS